MELTMSESEIRRAIRAKITHGNITLIREQYVLIHEWLSHAHYKNEMSTTEDAYNICKKLNCPVPGCPHSGRHLKTRDCAVECPVHDIDKPADGGCVDYSSYDGEPLDPKYPNCAGCERSSHNAHCAWADVKCIEGDKFEPKGLKK